MINLPDKIKKYIFILIFCFIFAPILFLASSCSLANNYKNFVSIKEAKKKSSALADYWFLPYSEGLIDDKAYNQNVLSAVYNFASNYDQTFNYLKTFNLSSKSDIFDFYKIASNQKAKIIIGPGYEHGDDRNSNNEIIMGKAARFFTDKTKNINNIHFIGIDTIISEGHKENIDKLTSIIYNSQYAGFLAGLYSIKHLEANQDKYDHDMVDGIKTFKVAAFGGKAISNITNWLDGFANAILLFGKKNKHGKTGEKLIPAADAATDNLGTIDVEMVYAGGTAPSAKDFSNGFEVLGESADKARIISRTLLEKGADIIFPVAGPQNILTIKEINKLNSKAKIIGVDSNQYEILTGKYKNKLIGSAIKFIKQDVMDALITFYYFETFKKNKKKNLFQQKKIYLWTNYYSGKNFVGKVGFCENNGKLFLAGKDSLNDIINLYDTNKLNNIKDFGKLSIDNNWKKHLNNDLF